MANNLEQKIPESLEELQTQMRDFHISHIRNPNTIIKRSDLLICLNGNLDVSQLNWHSVYERTKLSARPLAAYVAAQAGFPGMTNIQQKRRMLNDLERGFNSLPSTYHNDAARLIANYVSDNSLE